ncbi:hypothetical protein DEU56DRAFT_821803 [Suillus clintonianus]|uniref:uncharacterized protein n=1 Tax=Suillus clintonianus TaxID=1904413 RepID=UPI001B86C4A5|nr:uncharacterized protein DEU56DRAFT_821803 [Suillus clintonianus]KAG2126818.1 hypothetical protein DEU56DRAFT_821803 [Suillus clintonianus]
MSLYTPVFPPSLERRSTGRKGASSSNKLHQSSTTDILRDIHLFLATKPEVLAPSSRPSSPSFDENVERLKHSVVETVDAARRDSGDRKWKQVSEKLKMGCVRGRYRMTGLNQRWHPAENAEWILPDDEETWLSLEKERAEARRLKGNAKQSRHPDNASIPAIAPFRGSDRVDNQPPAEMSQALATVSPKTMQNVKEKVSKWQATISSPDGASLIEKTVSATPVLRSASKSGMKLTALPKDKSQSSSLGFSVVKRNVATVTGKKGKGRLGQHDPPNFRVHGDPEGDHTPSGSKSLVAPTGDEPERASFKTPLRSLRAPDGDLPKITDFPETPYIPPSFPSELETSTPQARHEAVVPVRTKPPPIYPVCPSSSISHPSIPREGDHHHSGEDPYIIDISPSLPPHSDARQTNKRPLSPSSMHDVASSTTKKQRVQSPPGETPAFRSRPPTQSANAPEVKSKRAEMPGSPRGEGRLPTLTELLAASPRPKTRQRPPLEHVLRAESEPSPHTAKENPSPAKSYFSTPGSGPSDSPTSNHNLLLHSPVSPMRSFAQNPNAFLPQFTSTQAGGSCHNGMSSGVFGGGYRSQFDVERHVDRVSELLEKDVDFGGWLRDVPSAEELEASQDQ